MVKGEDKHIYTYEHEEEKIESQEDSIKDNISDSKNDILFRDYKPIRITKEGRQKFMDLPDRFKEGLPIRIKMGKFYTDEELEKYIEDSLSRQLPGDSDDKEKNKIKRFIKKIGIKHKK